MTDSLILGDKFVNYMIRYKAIEYAKNYKKVKTL